MPPSPTISWWDTTAEKWNNEGISETGWDTETQKMSFYSLRLAAFSITQDRHLDLPYTWWSLRPCGPLMVELCVQAARFEFVFLITEAGLSLKGPDLVALHKVMYVYHDEDMNPIPAPSDSSV